MVSMGYNKRTGKKPYCFPMHALGPSEKGCAAFLRSVLYEGSIYRSGMNLSASLKFFSLWEAAQLPTETVVYSIDQQVTSDDWEGRTHTTGNPIPINRIAIF
jgi:hypothetical protein